MTARVCENCGFWREAEGPSGECRRHAPAPIARLDVSSDQVFEPIAQWPWTLSEDFCGEFEPVRKCRAQQFSSLDQAPPTGIEDIDWLSIFDENSWKRDD